MPLILNQTGIEKTKLNKLSRFNKLCLRASQPSIQEHVIVIALLYWWPITQMTSIVSLHCFTHDMCTRMPKHCFACRKKISILISELL